MSTAPAGPGPDAAPPSRGRGCLTGVGVAGAIVAAVVVGVVVAALVFRSVTSNQTSSGNAVERRPESSVEPPEGPRPAPSTAAAEPLAEHRMLVAWNPRPPFNPCGSSGPDFDVQVMGLDGSGPERLNPDAAVDAQVNTDEEEVWPRLSPDRRRFLFYRAPTGKTGETCRYGVQELWVADVDGSDARRLFSSDDLRAVGDEQGWPRDGLLQGHAEWAPDGRRIVMVLGHAPNLGPLPLLPEGELQLFVLDTVDGDLRQVTARRDDRSRGVTSDPSWTPDGRTILFVGCPDDRPSCEDTQIRAVAADAERATSTELVFDGPGRTANDVYVSPDGRSILWMEVGILRTDLYAAKYTAGRELGDDELVLLDDHGGYANWTADSSAVVYSRLKVGDQFALFLNRFDGRPSERLTPTGTEAAFTFPSP